MEDVRGPARGVGGSAGGNRGAVPPWVGFVEQMWKVGCYSNPPQSIRQRGAAGSAKEEEEDPARSN